MWGNKPARYAAVLGLVGGIVVFSVVMYRSMMVGHNVEGIEITVAPASKVTGEKSEKLGKTLPVRYTDKTIQSARLDSQTENEAAVDSPVVATDEMAWKDWVNGTSYFATMAKIFIDLENSGGGPYTTADVIQRIIDGQHAHRCAVQAMCPLCYEAIVVYEQTSLGEVMSDDAMQSFLKSDDFVYLYEYLNNNTRHPLHDIRNVGYKDDQDDS